MMASKIDMLNAALQLLKMKQMEEEMKNTLSLLLIFKTAIGS